MVSRNQIGTWQAPVLLPCYGFMSVTLIYKLKQAVSWHTGFGSLSTCMTEPNRLFSSRRKEKRDEWNTLFLNRNYSSRKGFSFPHLHLSLPYPTKTKDEEDTAYPINEPVLWTVCFTHMKSPSRQCLISWLPLILGSSSPAYLIQVTTCAAAKSCLIFPEKYDREVGGVDYFISTHKLILPTTKKYSKGDELVLAGGRTQGLLQKAPG